jgi:hypothetical protein
MSLIRPAALGLAALMAGPAIWQAGTGGLDMTSAVSRFLLAVPVAALMLAFLRLVTLDYRENQVPKEIRAQAAPPEPQPARDKTTTDD